MLRLIPVLMPAAVPSVSMIGLPSLLLWIKSFFDEKYVHTCKFHHPANVIPRTKTATYLSNYNVTGERALRILRDLKTVDVPKLQRKWSKVW